MYNVVVYFQTRAVDLHAHTLAADWLILVLICCLTSFICVII